ncbi:MAG: AtpZ/AtpI family protein [Ruminococcaceae bacterium]|nr:AtpZ/AtpI family protein [Oscillospiraceae bacterium]
MKDLTLIVWLTQLGLAVAVPMAGFVLLAVWLRDTLGWGQWVIFAGIGLGLICAINGLRNSLKSMERLSRRKQDDPPPPVSFNDHD